MKERVAQELMLSLAEANTGPFHSRSIERLSMWLEGVEKVTRREAMGVFSNVLYCRCLSNKSSIPIVLATWAFIIRLNLNTTYRKEFQCMARVLDECAASKFCEVIGQGDTPHEFWRQYGDYASTYVDGDAFALLLSVDDDDLPKYPGQVNTCLKSKLGQKMFLWAASRVARGHMKMYIESCRTLPDNNEPLTAEMLQSKYAAITEEGNRSGTSEHLMARIASII